MYKVKSKTIDKTNPNNLYVDITIFNDDTSQKFINQSPQIKFDALFDNNILDNCSEYEMYIERFSSQAGLCLPIWSPLIQQNQTDPNLTVYNFTMTIDVNGSSYSSIQYMEFESETNTYPPQNTNLLSQDNYHYYYVYTYSHIVYLFNNMLLKAYNDIQTQSNTNLGNTPPFMYYDATNSLFSLYFNQNQYAITSLIFDTNLYNMFNSFYFRNNTQLVIEPNLLNQVVINGTTYTRTTQDYISTSCWSPVDKIVFMTNKIPIYKDIINEPLFLNSDVSISSNSAKYGYKILTDFSIDPNTSSDWRQIFSYTSTKNRYINFKSDEPLNEIDINLFWSDKRSGLFIPLNLCSDRSIELKIGFRKI